MIKKDLKFIHITKTAGTSIEDIGINSKIEWGRFHTEYSENIIIGDWWHSFFPNKNKSLKDKYDWFTVVRNPYSRIISEYYYQFNDENTDKHEFNKRLQKNIILRPNNGGHYSEQHKYIDHHSKIKILKFEDLPNNFDQLMLDYNLDLKLNIHSNTYKHKKFFSVRDFDINTLNLINIIYKEDFSMFDYEKTYYA